MKTKTFNNRDRMLAILNEEIIGENVMEKYFNIKNMKGVRMLLEKNLNRMIRHLEEDGAIIISAQRDKVDEGNVEYYERWKKLNNIKKDDSRYKKEFLKWFNTKQTKSLIKDLKESGYSYVPVYGGYHDKNDRTSLTDSYEVSFVVYNIRRDKENVDFDYLFDFAIELCDKYMQDSVYVQAPGEAPNYYDCNGNIVNSKSSRKIITNDSEQEFFTALRPHRKAQRFTSDISFESVYINPKPSSIFNRMVRVSKGELLLD